MNLLLLKTKSQCPKCRREHGAKLYGQCRQCGMMLFELTHNFKAYEKDQGYCEYWVWHSENGWMHASQIERATVLDRDYKPDVLPDNYGTTDYLNQKIDESRIELKQALAEKKKGRLIFN